MATARKRAAAAAAFDIDMLVDLHRSGLDEADALTLGLTYCTEAPAGIAPAARGYKIPYFTPTGERTGFYRYRYLDDTRSGFERLSGVKQRRYSQPLDTTPEVYLPPLIDWSTYLQGAESLILTEGEKKAARVCKGGFPCMGLGGVWSFQNANHNESLLPLLAEANWAGRPVFIIYDSDAADKLQIQQAELRLARRLLRAGAQVFIVRLPAAEDGSKVGLDDYVQAFGMEALQDLCASVEPFEDSQALHAMNDEVAYVKDPGIVYVLKTGQLVSPADFKTHRFADRRHTKVVITKDGSRMEDKSTAEEWIKWPHRTAVEKLEFEPGQPTITHNGALNLWKGWAYTPRKGDVGPWHELTAHLFAGEPESLAWFEKWAAFPFQNPGAKMRSAVAMWGRKTGTGKSGLGYALGGLYGDAFAEIGDRQIEKSDFNSWARNRQFVLGDDITGNNNRSVANLLKTMISREKLEINLKHVQEYFTRDCLNYYFTSQSPDAFLLEEDDRRFFIHEMRGGRLSDDFYVRFATWRKSEAGRRALMYYLVEEVDCSGFSNTQRPLMTAAKAEMISMTRTDLESWLSGVRDDPDPFCRRYGNSDLVTVQELMTAYDPNGVHRVTSTTFARKLKELNIHRADPVDREPAAQVRVAPNGDLVRMYALRNQKRWLNATTAQLKEHYERSRKLTMRTEKAAKF